MEYLTEQEHSASSVFLLISERTLAGGYETSVQSPWMIYAGGFWWLLSSHDNSINFFIKIIHHAISYSALKSVNEEYPGEDMSARSIILHPFISRFGF
ncbi:hypothetical protein B1F79_01055 [Coxiella-like endosymbiont of Rhipicephalus sanguineus]|uniref:hypothetical protein n=1 Tax=Coxiella-like endosymbiont of Rhipicephalus sanguineus TaxID=1955402 RepID=UPI00203C3889|nr:hypothetical protein [Coxiella-like endosymbiont of Rhipicephalus sanguineus]MBT8506322.1 hypothetical protein [Coxiella-like endosymbiont of Rhipicephalus sanguineus]